MAEIPPITIAPIDDGSVGDESDFVTPLNELEQAANDILAANIAFTGLAFDPQVSVTISAGSITLPGTFVKVDTQGAASTDDLDEILPEVNGLVAIITSASASRTVVVKHGTGNIETAFGEDYSLTSPNMMVLLIFNGTVWMANMLVVPSTSVQPDILQIQVFS